MNLLLYDFMNMLITKISLKDIIVKINEINEELMINLDILFLMVNLDVKYPRFLLLNNHEI
jgi:hypothetical protein